MLLGQPSVSNDNYQKQMIPDETPLSAIYVAYQISIRIFFQPYLENTANNI